MDETLVENNCRKLLDEKLNQLNFNGNEEKIKIERNYFNEEIKSLKAYFEKQIKANDIVIKNLQTRIQHLELNKDKVSNFKINEQKILIGNAG